MRQSSNSVHNDRDRMLLYKFSLRISYIFLADFLRLLAFY